MTSAPKPPIVNKPRTPRASLSPRSSVDSLEEYAAGSTGGTGGSGGFGPDGFVSSAAPWGDLSNISLPEDPREMYAMCSYLAVMSEVHKAYVRNMACLPATQPRIKSNDNIRDTRRSDLRREGGTYVRPRNHITDRIKNLVDDHLRLKKFNQEAGIAFHTYSAAVVVLYFPFIKMLRCTRCRKSCRADETDWRLEGSDGRFMAVCKHCGYQGHMMATDRHVQSEMDIEISVLDMNQVYTMKSGYGNHVDIYYEIPKEDIERLRGESAEDRSFILRTPQSYLEAALGFRRYQHMFEDKPVVKLRKDQCYLMRSAHLPMGKNGLPIPGFMASIKPYWMMRMLGRASEAIANQNIIPLDILYPESSSKTSNLFEMIHVASYMDVIRGELAKHKEDPNYRPVMPFPVASHRVGGDGKNLLLSSEIRVYMEILCAALECPIEFIFGGLSYSGSDVSIQQMIKKIEDYRCDLLDMNRWVMRRVCEFMGWPQVVVEFKEFRLGQDLPFTQFMASMAAQGQVSWRRVHGLLDIDTDTERDQIRADVQFEMEMNRMRTKLDADVHQEIMLRQALAQAEGQVKGKEALLEESLELARRVRADEELYEYVTGSSQAAMEVFGDRAPETMPTHNTANASMVPTSPDPMLLAPTTANEDVVGPDYGIDPGYVDSIVQDMPMIVGEQDLSEVPEIPDNDLLIQQLVEAFAHLDMAQWAHGLGQIEAEFGPQVAQMVSARLYNAGATIGQRSTYAQGQRGEFTDYGTPF